ncbi:MAG: AraC family transcriptional regulator [Leptospira sp.]|uniref:Helix-turn-helix domain-containing protein n=1 Tax=Leptospira paudalimensis TaxID=2950024 RepID=A0ABT3M5K4_9LEPT|nr:MULTISPECIES: helix-turn-helix domain-containing protein [Leptospira]MBL0953167.1 AraC family transcriptional regulator [Leptospira sp.]MCW7503296.1 helix-turn-helix domain-containing protein [Leptospira paudalimensis]
MSASNPKIPKDLEFIAKGIFVFESMTPKKEILPFFADGFPGLVFFHSIAPVKVIVGKLSKIMNPVFIYGQTLEPIQIEIEGPYFFVMVQLFPSFVESSFGIPITELTNSCWTIQRSEWTSETKFHKAIQQNSTIIAEEAILDYLHKKSKGFLPDLVLHSCLQTIIDTNGNCEIFKIASDLKMSERTLQRKFQNYVGLTPKQFATIIRFQTSLFEMKAKKESKLTDIAYNIGYADQSHFIRQFKSFTKEKPFQFREKNDPMSGLSNF